MKVLKIAMRIVLLFALVIGSFSLIPAQTASALTVTVCPSGCTFTTVAAAVAAANPGDVISIAAGTYPVHNIDISKNLTFTGAGSALTILDAQHTGYAFMLDSGKTASMTGLTFKNGNVTTTDQDGGAIFSQGNLSLNDTKFLSNHTDDMGGAIFSEGGSLTISNSVFDSNTVNTARLTGASGGAIASASIGSLSLTNVKFTNNVSKNGGAVAILEYGHQTGKTFVISNSTFANNTATEQGGGIWGNQIDTTIVNSVINDNGATNSFGGGMYFKDLSSKLILRNVTVSHNHGLNGGGIYLGQTLSTSLNTVSIVLNNSTDTINNGGGGIYTDATTSLDIKNSIIAANTDTAGGTSHPDCYFSATSVTYSLMQNPAGCSATTFTHNLTGVAPKIDALANYGGPTFTHRLQSTSPAIDAADNATCPASDQRGSTRPKDGNSDSVATCDMGAYEVPTTATVTVASTAAEDGWVLESTEISNAGGTFNNSATTFRLGDDATKKQYRGILSFSTGAAIPDNATVTGVTLKVKKQSITGGGDPVITFQGFMADVKKGMFGTAALEATDFQTAATTMLGPTSPAAVSNVYSINLTGAATSINLLASNGGLTQIRLRFKLDDNNDAIANYLSLFSSNTTTVADRPKLVITYTTP